MAEPSGQQRQFAKSINRQTAQQIRENTNATVKAHSEQSRPRLCVVDPVDYEGELSARRRDLEKEQFLNLLLFPQQDISVTEEKWDHRTEISSVPQNAPKDLSTSLLTSECLKLYTSELHKVSYNHSRFASGYSKILNPDYHKHVAEDTFELDQIDAERLASLDSTDTGTIQTKKGYLYRGPFPSDGGSVSLKNYRKRFAVLKGSPSDGGYILYFYKDEKSSNLKGKVPLDTCSEIKKNSRNKPNGFDLVTEDDRVFYPLAAETEAELEDWTAVLSKAIGLDTEETDVVASPMKLFYDQDTMVKDKKIPFQPELLEYTSNTEAVNAQNREKDRHPLFHVYPEVLEGLETGDQHSNASPPREEFGMRFIISCSKIKMMLTAERNGRLAHVEPFYVTLAVFDAQRMMKISEDFHIDLNDPDIREMVGPGRKGTGGKERLHPLARQATSATEAIFSVTFPHPDVFLVARVEKVLQGGIAVCAEPYLKPGENTKASQKLARHMPAVCSRLGEYKMPFVWAARPLFSSGDELDTSVEFTSLYRQEKEKLSDDELLKILADFKNIHKQKLHFIPGSLQIEVQPFNSPLKRTLTPALIPVKGPSGDSASPGTPILEVREFAPLEAFRANSPFHPHLSLVHHLYVYPLSLKYDSQKYFAKARNLACCVQFKDSDEKNSEPLSVIFSKYPGSIFTEKSNTAVIHHCTTPSFYEEVKVRLPIRLTQKHHLLFIFYHISCDVQKANKSSGKGSTKQWPVESPVGFAWLPILDENGRVFGAGHSLPVATSLPPDYLSSSSATTPSSPTANASSTPGHGRSVQTHVTELKWVDNHKPLFRVCLKLDSSICTDDPLLHQFFCLCEGMQLGSLQEGQDPIIPQEELMVQLRELQNMNLTSAIHFLPSLFKQLFLILCCSSMEAEPAKREVLRLLIVLVDRLVVADKAGLLRTYIEYMFVTELDKTRKKAVHDELARLLVQYLKNEQEGLEIRRLLDHLWFFLEITLKSMAQYLEMANKLAASRKNRYPEDFGWNLQSMSTIILNNIRGRHTEPSAKRANSSLADFVKRSFSFMDRGVVFKIISKYLEAFSVRENITVAQLKLEFLRIVCDHEHFIPLNLPFPIPAEMMEYSLTDEFCRKHFLVGVLLREVESSLQYEAAPVRRKTIKVLRNLLAKHDSDPRCPEAVQKARIAALYFPLVPVVLDHVGRLDGGCPSYVSPMLNATSMACYSNGSSSSSSNTPSNKHKVTPDKHTGHKSSHSKATGTNIPSLLQVPALPRIESEPSLESMTATSPADLSISTATGGGGPSDAAPPLSISPVPFSMEQTVFELNKLTVEETRDLLISVLFVLKHIDPAVLVHWWKKCISSGTRAAVGKFQHASAQQSDRMPPQFSLVLDFFDMLESCLYTFKYHGRQAISMKLSTSSDQQHSREASSSDNMPSTSSTFPSSTVQPSPFASLQPSREKEKPSKRSSVSSTSSSYSGGKSRGGLGGRASTISGVPTANPSASLPPMHLRAIVPPELIEDRVRTEGALSYEVGIVVLGLLQSFEANFKHELSQEEGDNIIMVKYFSLLMLFLQVNQSVSLQTHIFASVRAFIHKFREALFRGSPEYCGILCYEVLHLCNSRVPSTRTEACALLYLLMRCNFEYFKGKGFVRTHLQSTIAVSKIVSTLLGQSDSNLRKSLGTIAAYATQDDSVKGVTFPSEVKDLIKRLKTVLSVTAQMKVHQNDPEKLVDLHYSLAKSYGTSPELRHTWLDSIATLHLKYGNFSEVAHCCIHIAGLVAEYLKIKGKYPAGCGAFHSVSLNVEMEESGIKEDAETGEEQRYTERNLVSLLESSINYLEQAQRYEVMSEVFKVLQPFYEKSRDFKKMTEMYGKLHEAFEKVVSVMTTGKRYLGTYFRVSFFGKLFGEDSDKQYVYKEPTVTTLGEFTLRLQKLYSRKFGSTEIVHIIKESGKVNTSTLDMDQAYVQITHVEPFFAPEELEERVTRFERENKISRFVYETPFSLEDSKAHGDVTKQCIRKTILTSSHWFPYIKKRILVIDQVQFELSAIQVAIEAMSKKTKDLAGVIQMDPPDLKRLQLLLQGSISTQVNQGAQEYANCFLREPHLSQQPKPHTDTLREVYRYFMRVCQDGLELNGRLISTDQLLYQEELRNKFESMQSTLLPLIKLEEESRSRPSSPSSSSEAGAVQQGYTAHNRRPAAGVDPHRMSALLFHSISGNR